MAVIEERVRLENRLAALEDSLQRFEQHKLALASIATHHGELLAARGDLPKDRFTEDDRRKLALMQDLMRDQIKSYGFSTFPESELEVSEENYRPQREGFDIGFELSASDAIRLKWAYQISLLELARSASTQHPGLVIFDEPQQQKTAKVSFKRLLERAAESKLFGQQVVFATSEDRELLDVFLEGVDCNLMAFDGPLVRRL